MNLYLVGAGVAVIVIALWRWRRSIRRQSEFEGLQARIKKQKEMQDAGAKIDSSQSGVIDSLREDRF